MRLTPTKILVTGTTLVVTLWLFYGSLNLGRPIQAWGVFGDKFGALSCLFTGLALVGLVAGYWHEREESAGRARDQIEILMAMRELSAATLKAAQITALAARLQQAEMRRTTMLSSGHAADHSLEYSVRDVNEEIEILTSELEAITRK